MPTKESLNPFFPSLASSVENEIDVEEIAKTRRPTRPTRPPKPAMSVAASTSTYFPPDKEKNNYLLRPTKPWVKISGLATTPATSSKPSTRFVNCKILPELRLSVTIFKIHALYQQFNLIYHDINNHFYDHNQDDNDDDTGSNDDVPHALSANCVLVPRFLLAPRVGGSVGVRRAADGP